MNDLLYRGINPDQYASLLANKSLEAKGTEFTRVIYFDGGFKFDGSFTFDKSEQNAIVAHQKDSGKYSTSGISTTPHWSRAAFYALNKLENYSGYILVFEKSVLSANRILIYPVKERMITPQVPEDDEVILVAKDNTAISLDLVKQIEKVERIIVR